MVFLIKMEYSLNEDESDSNRNVIFQIINLIIYFKK